jgi:hypothetical protein
MAPPRAPLAGPTPPGLNHTTPVAAPGGSVYAALERHQTTEDWGLRDLLGTLHLWKGRFDTEFGLDVGEVALCVDWLPVGRFGHFRYGHNGFSLWGELAINRRYLHVRPFWMTLGTELHELLHAWQQRHGRPGRGNYHNAEFRARAREYGLVVNERGHTQYLPTSRFLDLLHRYGVEVPSVPPVQTYLRGSSKLKKWTCGCTNARVAVPDFAALCLHCGNLFARADLN